MPKSSSSRVPSYRRHKPTGQAVVTINGQDIYLGKWNKAASKAEYDRLIAEFLANGRRLHSEIESSVVEVINAYRKFAERYYRKNGEVTREYGCIKEALKIVRELYGRTNANDFGPLALKAVRQRMIDNGWSRGYVNKSIGRIRRCFKWAVENELVRPDMYHGLMAVSGLRKGRSEAREPDPVQPVDDATVQATLPHLTPIVADMIRLQRITGCRPQDVCNLRPCDVDMSSDVWLYRPDTHKTEHHGRERIIPIGPKGQDILRSYLLRDKESYCFRPIDSEKKRRAAQHANRQTPLSCGNKPGSNRKKMPKRTAGEKYITESYRRAIHRACDSAFPVAEPLCRRDGESVKQFQERLTEKQLAELDQWQSDHRWSPNRLRHSAGTEIRKRYGLEAAQVILGHASADVTQVYAERDLTKAVEIMREVG
ncbi:MAG: site-specific integrase [Pirellulales bacterium]|nr:site-specific integrase [Pirellulales bacterium]